MSLSRQILLTAIFLITGYENGNAQAVPTPTTVERPPLYVMFAFDGSKSLDMWEETRQFARSMNEDKRPLQFTYFINSTYYLAEKFRLKYNAPVGGPGKSAIGFGGTVADVQARFDQTNFAAEDGHEIANHAAGHFDGSHWTYDQWDSELRQFGEMLFDKFNLNNAIKWTKEFPQGWVFNKSDMVGFRAPQLGLNNAMYAALQQRSIKYDTSRSATPNLWPKKNAQGMWSFPLAEIPVAGTKRRTLSMDYNFYYIQSRGLPDAAKGKQYEEQMYLSYMSYIQNNYNGNRAPINIGHHFSLWNGGAYWRAMKRVATKVCGMPEVHCVTYKELMAFLETKSAATLNAYERGNFKKAKAMAEVQPDNARPAAALGLFGSEPTVESGDYFIADPPEAHDE